MGGHRSGLFHGTSGEDLPSRILNSEISNNQDEAIIKVDETKPETQARDRLLSQATTEQTKKIIEELFRKGAEVGDGGTADAIRAQARDGTLVGGKDHIRKGQERLRQIEKILNKDPNHPDKDLLMKLKDDLEDALKGVQK